MHIKTKGKRKMIFISFLFYAGMRKEISNFAVCTLRGEQIDFLPYVWSGCN